MTVRPGTVYLVGAGPGDPGLITVRGQELLRRADVVLHDRLVLQSLLLEAPPTAELIDVGKEAVGHASRQADINAALVAQARAGRVVVRLKGGDPFVFGRGWEELEACRAAGVPCEVIPGLSSAIAGPAAAGIPVTCRGVASSVAVSAAPRR
jgi:uroporphyrin-III C-methyltransferase